MRRSRIYLLSYALVAVGTVELLLYIRTFQSTSRARTYTDADNDLLFELPVPPRGHVAMYMQDTVHYPLFGPTAQSQWDRLAPGKGIVHLGRERRPFMVSMFHQLRCLDIIRHGVLHANSDPGGANRTSNEGNWELRHCMNYIRQMVMCRASTRLEVAVGLYLEHNTLNNQDYVCDDWEAIYSAVSQLQNGSVSL